MAEKKRRILLVERHAERAKRYASLLESAADVQIVPSLLDTEPGSPVDDDVITVVNAILQTRPEMCDIGMVLLTSPLYDMAKFDAIQRTAGQVSPTPQLAVLPMYEYARHEVNRLNKAGGTVAIIEIPDVDFESYVGPEVFYSTIMNLLYSNPELPSLDQNNNHQ